MSAQQYSLVESHIAGKKVFGLAVTFAETEIFRCKYISENESDVRILIRQMSADYISPKHFRDIISDFIYKLYYEKIQLNALAECAPQSKAIL